MLPVVLQHADTGEVLFVGYANEKALAETLRVRQAVLWSTSRNELWHKGATSGDWLDLVDVRVNCEQNSLLYRVRPRSGVCHTKDASGKAQRATTACSRTRDVARRATRATQRCELRLARAQSELGSQRISEARSFSG